MWSFQHGEAEPDVIVISKAVGGGVPMAVIAYRPAHDAWPEGAFTGTFRGSSLAFAAGAATLRTIREEKLADNAADRGAELLAELRAATCGSARIGDVRGRGLMIGIEVVKPSDAGPPGPPDPETASRLRLACIAAGLLVEIGGMFGNVVRLLPPLVVTSADVAGAVDRFAAALQQVEERR
jgi:diaminobutyrate-2-oxoglutarate transaminase